MTSNRSRPPAAAARAPTRGEARKGRELSGAPPPMGGEPGKTKTQDQTRTRREITTHSGESAQDSGHDRTSHQRARPRPGCRDLDDNRTGCRGEEQRSTSRPTRARFNMIVRLHHTRSAQFAEGRSDVTGLHPLTRTRVVASSSHFRDSAPCSRSSRRNRTPSCC